MPFYCICAFVFVDTQPVRSSIDNINREISVSLVGTQFSDTRILEFTDKLVDYDLGNFTLYVMQNKHSWCCKF